MHWNAYSSEVPYDFREGDHPYQTAPHVVYTSGEFTNALKPPGDMRPDGFVPNTDLDKWVRGSDGSLSLDGRDLVHWNSDSDEPYDFR